MLQFRLKIIICNKLTCMLKKLLLLMMFAGASFTASAQYLTGIVENEPVNGNSLTLRYAAKAGLNITTVSTGALPVNSSVGAGFQIGGAINIRWGYSGEYSSPGSGLFGVQPELLFSYQTISVDGGDKLRLNRISLPLVFRAYPLSSVYCEIGPELSYLLSTSPDKMTIGSAVYSVGECAGMTTDIAIGAGWESGKGYFAGLRYGIGLTGLAKNLPWKTHNISLTIGWMF